MSLKKYSQYYAFKPLLLIASFVISMVFVLSFQRSPQYTTVDAAGVLGDANNDCRVDGIDFVIWLNHYNPSAIVTGGPSIGDFDSSSRVDGIDFVIWLNHYGQTCPVTTITPTLTPTSVPTGTLTPTPRPSTTTVVTATPTGTSNTTYDDIRITVDRYFAAHPGPNGNGGTGLDHTWDLNELSSSQLSSSPDAQKLLSMCPLPGQRPVYPKLAWEYGGSDHQWINPGASALLYCVYTPVNPGNSHWRLDPSIGIGGRVFADVYVKFPDQNPCKNNTGRDQVAACIGDPTNFEILVDTASYHDGTSVGYNLAESTSELFLILPNGTKVSLILNL